MNTDTMPILDPIEARILAVLVEKAKTTPDTYPLTLNALVAGCDQKTSREPVMSLDDAEVQAGIESLRSRHLVVETYGASGRVPRYAHTFAKVYGVPSAAVDLLATLMLRGPQTVSELRANCERLHHFADGDAVEGYLDELARIARTPLGAPTQWPGIRGRSGATRHRVQRPDRGAGGARRATGGRGGRVARQAGTAGRSLNRLRPGQKPPERRSSPHPGSA
jgi:uncharacterized protein YceH (UPF0502 family)